MPRITRREWRTVLLYTLCILLLTSLPYAIGWLRQGADWRFSGFVFGVEDGFSYLAKMRLGARGLLDFYLFYTPEPHTPVALVFLPYILPGWLVGRFISPQDSALLPALTLTFHLMRIIFDALYIAVLYRFIAAFLRAPRTRFTALLLATLGGGLGWLLLLLAAEPPEFLIPEGFSFLILLGLPHLALARAAFLGGFLCLFRALSSPTISLRPLIFSALCWLVVGFAVPFYLAILYVILAVWGLCRWGITRRFPLDFARKAGVAAALTLPLFFYFSLSFASNPTFSLWSAQNILRSPPPLNYLLAYGLITAYALLAVRWASRKTNAPHYALLFWPLVVPLLVYLPMITVQRRLAEAVIIPLAILAAAGLRLLARHPLGKRLRPLLLVLMFTSTLIFFVVSTLVVFQPAAPLYRHQNELDALNWLNTHAPADSVVLADYALGNILPAYTNLRPFVGHGPETLRADEKKQLVERFFSGSMPLAERQTLYAAYNIRYIIQRIESNRPISDTNWAGDARLIYDEAGYRIYELEAEAE